MQQGCDNFALKFQLRNYKKDADMIREKQKRRFLSGAYARSFYVVSLRLVLASAVLACGMWLGVGGSVLGQEIRTLGFGPTSVEGMPPDFATVARSAIRQTVKTRFPHFTLVEDVGFPALPDEKELSYRELRERYQKQKEQKGSVDVLVVVSLKSVELEKGDTSQKGGAESRVVVTLVRTQDFREIASEVMVLKGKLERTALKERAAGLMASVLLALPFKAWVIETHRGGRVYINGGSLLGLNVGDKVLFVKPRPEVVHPFLPKVSASPTETVAEGVVLSAQEARAFVNITSRGKVDYRIMDGHWVTW